MKVLIADDDQDDRDLFAEALKEVNAEIDCIFATDGCEALEILTDMSHPPEYIFLDINMPKMTGMQCLVEIKKYTRLKYVPVIIISTTLEKTEIEKCITLGAFKYIPKPNDFRTLVSLLKELLNNASP